MELKTSIEELKQSLLESEAFVRYQKVRAEVHNYPEKEYRLHEFRRKNYFLQNSREQLDLFTEEDRLEQEYLSLFLGKQFRQRIVREFSVVPSKDEPATVVCRFSDTAGLLSADDLSGRPVLLELAPENKAQSLAPERRASKDSRGTILYRVADMVNCRLMDGNREIAQSRLPLYQFGQVIELPVTSVK